jgi:hypothetical protein
MVFRYLFLIGFFYVSLNVYGQRDDFIYITFDTKTWDISESDKQKIPFDQAFIIRGSFGEDSEVNSIKLKYKLLNHCRKDSVPTDNNCLYYYKKRKHYYFYNAENKLRLEEDGYVHLDSVTFKGNIKKFEIPVGPLHDNEKYIFSFEVTKKKIISPDEQQKLKKEIIIETKKAFDYRTNNGNIIEEYAELIDNVNNIVTETLSEDKFYNESGQVVTFENLLATDISIVEKKNEIFNLNDNLRKYNQALSFGGKHLSQTKYARTDSLILLLNSKSEIIKSSIDEILEHKDFSEIINEPLNRVVDDQVSVKEVLEFISSDIERWAFYSLPNEPDSIPTNRYIIEVLLGRAKIKGNIIENTDKFDQKSGLLLWSAFNFLQNAKYKNGKKVLPFEWIKPIYENLEKWNSNVQSFDNLNDELFNQSDNIADLFNDLYSKNNVQISISTTELLKTRESKYLGIDFGAMFAPEISSTFVFEGFNFYFKPVNKNVSTKDIKGWDRVFKTMSLSFGIAQRVGNTYNDNYEELVGVGSPFVGMGYRLNKNLRLSSGAIFYESTNFNPLITETQVKSTYFFALSLDVSFQDIIKTLSGIK